MLLLCHTLTEEGMDHPQDQQINSLALARTLLENSLASIREVLRTEPAQALINRYPGKRAIINLIGSFSDANHQAAMRAADSDYIDLARMIERAIHNALFQETVKTIQMQ